MKYVWQLSKIYFLGLFLLANYTSLLGQHAQGIIKSAEVIPQGKIVLKMDYLDSILNKNPIKTSALPDEMILVFNGDQWRTEIYSEYTHSSIFSNLSTKSVESFIEFRNKKSHIHFNLDTLLMDAFNRNNYTVANGKETKTILGYPCNQIIIHYNNRYLKDAILYVNTDIKNYSTPISYAFGKIQGMILEMFTEYQGIPLHILASQIQKIPISNDYFNPNDNTPLISREEFIKRTISPN